MWAEKMRSNWQHTSTIAAYVAATTGSKKKVTPDDINPMETGKTSGIKLNSPDGFQALSTVARHWQNH